MLIALVELVLGLVVLFGGGHYLVRGSTAVALLLRISPAVVGLTVVAMGTSMPELAVSLDAAAKGVTDISYGNIIGSNIFNIGAILGIAALLGTIPVQRQTIRIEYPFMLVVSALVVLLGRDGIIDHLEGIFFIVSLVLFLSYIVYLTRRDVLADDAVNLEREVRRAAHANGGTGRALGRNVAFIVLGIGGLILGAELVVQGAVTVARTLGIEDRVIGLTIVAMGTSLPELATTVVAAKDREQEIALGNIVGSNIFNMLAILGTTAAIIPVPIHPRAGAVDNWVMLGFAAVLLPMMAWGKCVSRRDGVVLLVGFVAYMTWVVVVR